MATTTQNATDAAEARRFPFPLSPSEGWPTVVLAVALVLITVGCIQSLAWTAGMDILTSTTLIGMLLGFILAKQRTLPQTVADVPALALGILFAFWQTARADEGGHVGVLWRHLSAWVSSARSGTSSNDDAIFLLFLAVLTMLLGYVSMWLIFRSRSPWLAAAANGVVLLINLNYATDAKGIYAVLFLLVALLLIMRFNLVERMRIWKRKGLRYPPELGWDFMQAGVIFIIIVMVMGALLPSSAVNLSLQTLWNAPNSPWQTVQSTFGRLFHISGGTSATKVAFGNSLSIQGTVNLPTSIQFTYETTDLSGSYFQAVTFDTFDGHNWTRGPQQSTALPPNTAIYPETSAYSSVGQTIHIVNAPAGNDIYTLGEQGSFTIPTIVQNDGLALKAGDTIGSYTNWGVPHALQNGQSYQATSYTSTATLKQLEAVPGPDQNAALYPSAFMNRYTQLPADLQNLGNPVALTAKVWSGKATTMYDKLAALIAGFKTNGFVYSTTNPNPPANQDSAAFFLQIKQGYCTWYATGLAMMARELGIPARVVEGFTGGELNAKTGLYEVSGTDAHAWVQVYFPAYGWVNFEATNAFPAFKRASSSTSTGTSDPGVPTRPKPGGAATPQPGHSTTPPISVSVPGTGGGNAVVGAITLSLSTLLALILLVALVVLAWWRLLYRRLSPISQTFARMALLGRLAGVPPKPAQTAAEYGATLAREIPDQRTEIETITELYVRERWSPQAPDVNESLGMRWRTLRDRLLRRITQRRKG
jgi:transglutaminase-like putative cysteine protease